MIYDNTATKTRMEKCGKVTETILLASGGRRTEGHLEESVTE